MADVGRGGFGRVPPTAKPPGRRRPRTKPVGGRWRGTWSAGPSSAWRDRPPWSWPRPTQSGRGWSPPRTAAARTVPPSACIGRARRRSCGRSAGIRSPSKRGLETAFGGTTTDWGGPLRCAGSGTRSWSRRSGSPARKTNVNSLLEYVQVQSVKLCNLKLLSELKRTIAEQRWIEEIHSWRIVSLSVHL